MKLHFKLSSKTVDCMNSYFRLTASQEQRDDFCVKYRDARKELKVNKRYTGVYLFA